MNLTELTRFLDSTLEISDFASADSSLNGLQVGDPNDRSQIEKVAFAVDACMDTFTAATAAGAQLLVVHHGLFWSKSPLTGTMFERVDFLLKHRMALYACHLPLDAHGVYGNNASIAKAIGLENLEGFCRFRGRTVGFKGTLPRALTSKEIVSLLGLEDSLRLSLDFGPEKCSRVGVLSGRMEVVDLSEAIDQGLDLLITGEPIHEMYHYCREAALNVLCLGHYATETFGVRSLQSLLGSMGLQTAFVDVPTGL